MSILMARLKQIIRNGKLVSVISDELDNNSVGTENIKDSSITGSKISNGSIDKTKINASFANEINSKVGSDALENKLDKPIYVVTDLAGWGLSKGTLPIDYAHHNRVTTVIGNVTELTLTVNSNAYINEYNTTFIFTSGQTATTIIKDSNNIIMTGKDVKNGELIPASNKRYKITFRYDSPNIIGTVESYSTIGADDSEGGININDEKPVYTEASSLSQLTSAEKISTAFGKIAKSVSTLISHIANVGNPHSTTKAQVGLGNVPNVTTNNQTPTYTVATSNSELVSGETVDTAFGKIAKAVKTLISHIANVSNPHSTTKAQVGLGNVDNTSDIDKPISAATQTALDNKSDKLTYWNTFGAIITRPLNNLASDVTIYSGNMTKLIINEINNNAYVNEFCKTLIFTSGSTPAIFSVVDGVIMVGKDVRNGIFTPTANMRYKITFTYDNINFIGKVEGYSTTGVDDDPPKYSYGTEDLEAGVSDLETGKLHFVYV